MIAIVGLVLLLVGLLAGVGILFWLGVALVIVGLVLNLGYHRRIY